MADKIYPIPENVLRSKKIPANAKLLMGVIIDLCNDKGYCWAGNTHFAELFGVSITSISLWITSLRENDFITCKIYANNSRNIFLKPSLQKLKAPSLRKVKHNKHSKASLGTGLADSSDDSIKMTTKRWVDKNGKKHSRTSIDYGYGNEMEDKSQ